jgi:hypothetical protein
MSNPNRQGYHQQVKRHGVVDGKPPDPALAINSFTGISAMIAPSSVSKRMPIRASLCHLARQEKRHSGTDWH